MPKIGKKREKIRKNGKKRKNQEGSFPLPLLTYRAGFATTKLQNDSNLHLYTGEICSHMYSTYITICDSDLCDVIYYNYDVSYIS